MSATLEKMMRAGEHALVLREAERLFEQTAAPREDQASIAVYACFAAGASRQWGVAAEWARRGLELNPTDIEVEGKLRFHGGTALFYMGDFYTAEQDLGLFLAMTTKNSSLARLEGEATYNLGFVNRALRRPEAEVRLFRKAAEIFQGQGRSGKVNICRYETAWSLLLAGQTEEGREQLEIAERGLAIDPDAELAIDIEIAWALYHHRLAEIATSKSLCERLTASGALLKRQAADVFWIKGLNALADEDICEAQRCSEQALSAAAEVWIPTQMDRIERFRMDAYASTGTGM